MCAIESFLNNILLLFFILILTLNLLISIFRNLIDYDQIASIIY
jgi:hypothetical protein